MGVQPPDLLVYSPGRKGVGFVEVEGPTDRVSPLQLRSHRAIEDRFECEVEIIRVKYDPLLETANTRCTRRRPRGSRAASGTGER
jgi:hypothetical protein